MPDFISLTRHVPVPRGLFLINDYIDRATEAQLLRCIEQDSAVAWIDSFSRRVKHYGYEFDYEALSIAFDKQLGNIPDTMLRLLPHHRDEFDAADMSETEREAVLAYSREIDQCTINEYERGQGIRPHIEATHCFANRILSLSLLSPIIMDFRHKTSNLKKSLLLPPRSLLLIGGEARYDWSHGIAHRKSDVIDGVLTPRQRRVSLTFRKVKQPSFSSTGASENLLVSPAIEANHVHSVYDRIAPHFSHTRHSGWPQVIAFIESVRDEFEHPLLADIGCGNGKYLKLIRETRALRDAVHAIGMDFSANLCRIVARRGCDVFVSDALLIPFADASFEAVLNIAVLHHISQPGRRLRLLAELFRITRVQGRGFVCAWAFEQDGSSRHDFKKRDVFVPWNLSKRKSKRAQGEDEDDLVLQRYCHVYKQGELEGLVARIANVVGQDGRVKDSRQRCEGKRFDVEIVRSFYNKGNWCFEYRRHR